MDFLDFMIRQLLALLGALAGALLSRSWQPLERFLQTAGGGGGGLLLLIIALLAFASLLMLAGALVFYLRRQRRGNAARPQSVRSK